MNKEELKNMLKAMSKEDLLEVIVEMQTEEEDSDIHSIDKTKNNRRRGKGHRKKKSNAKRSSTRGRSTKKFGSEKGEKARSGSLDLSGNRPNKFEDFMDNMSLSSSERNELDEAGVADKANSETKKSPRSRGNPMVDVYCMICEKEDSVSAALVNDPSRYTCNNCCTRR